MHVYKRATSKVWWCRFMVCGQRIRRSTGKLDKRSAEAWAQRLRAELVVEATLEIGTLEGCRRLDSMRAKQIGLKARAVTLETHWSHLCRLLGPTTACHRLSALALKEYVVSRRDEGVCTGTIKRELQTLRRGLDLGRDEGWLVIPPKMPDVGRHRIGSKRKGRRHDVSVLRQWMAQLSGEALALAVTAVTTGLRRTELERMQWSWVERDDHGYILRVPAEAAKNRHERVVGIPTGTIGVLLQACSRVLPGPGGALTNDGPVFTGNDPRRPWERARRSIGYTTRISFRDLRTTFASLAGARSTDIAAVQAAMGHSDLAVTQLYMHATLAEQRAASDAVSAAVFGGPPCDDDGTASTASAIPSSICIEAASSAPSTAIPTTAAAAVGMVATATKA